jgi:hypothetical protein
MRNEVKMRMFETALGSSITAREGRRGALSAARFIAVVLVSALLPLQTVVGEIPNPKPAGGSHGDSDNGAKYRADMQNQQRSQNVQNVQNNDKSALDRLKEKNSFRALQKVEQIEGKAKEDMEYWAVSPDDNFNERGRLIHIEKWLLQAQAQARKNNEGQAVDDAFTQRLNELQQKLQENRARDVRDKVEEIRTSPNPKKQKLKDAANLLDVDLVGKGIYPPEVEAAFNKASRVWFHHRGRSASRRNGDGHEGLNSLFYKVVQMSLIPDYFPESTIGVKDWDLEQASKSPEGRAMIKALPGAQDRLSLLEMRAMLQQE